MARWLDYLFNIWQFRTIKIRPIVKIIAIVGSQFSQMLNIYSKEMTKDCFKFWLSGEISPNLVTLPRPFKISQIWPRDTVKSQCIGGDGNDGKLSTRHWLRDVKQFQYFQGEDGSGAIAAGGGFEFGVDPNEDPELALALRVSMEEQRARQEAEAAAATRESAVEGSTPAVAATAGSVTDEDAMLQRALSMSMETDDVNLEAMTEEEQVSFFFDASKHFNGFHSSLPGCTDG